MTKLKVRVPETLDEAVAELGGLGELLTATEWHRAAIVATFVRLAPGRGKSGDPDFESPAGFAERGIVGLRDDTQVRHYVQCWLDENGGNYPARGAVVMLPTATWPPRRKNLGSRATPSNIGNQMAESPELAEAAAQALADDDILRQVDKRTSAALGRAADRKFREDFGPVEQPERRKPKPPLGDDDEPDEAYWASVLKALNLIVDAQHRIARGFEPPPSVAFAMQIILPAKDLDIELSDLLGDPS